MTISADQISPYLTLERAEEINDAMFAMALERDRILKVSTAQIELLKGASLMEMAQAGNVIKAAERRRNADRLPGTAQTISMVCDDRIVAAIYAFVNFVIPPASRPDDDDYAMLVVRDTARTWFLVGGSRENKPDADDDE